MLRYVIIFLLIATLILGGCRKTTITEPQKHPVTITLQQPTPSARKSLLTVQQPKQSTQTKEKRHINIFQYIFYLGIILFIFDFIWKWIISPINALLIEFLIRLPESVVDKWIALVDKWIALIKAFKCYLLTSLVAALTLKVIRDNPNILSIILFAFIGVFALYITFASSLYEAQKEGITIKEYEIILMFGTIILFIIALFIPVIAINPLTIWLFKVIDWIYNLKVIGWLIRFIGILYVLAISWYGFWCGFLLVSLLVSSIIDKLREWLQK
jgi:hypothetical protein